MFLLEFQHFVFAIAEILFNLDQLLGDRGRDVAALVGAHAFLYVEIFLHHGIEIGLSVIRRRADRFQFENRGARFLSDRESDFDRWQFRMCRADERLGSSDALRRFASAESAFRKSYCCLRCRPRFGLRFSLPASIILLRGEKGIGRLKNHPCSDENARDRSSEAESTSGGEEAPCSDADG